MRKLISSIGLIAGMAVATPAVHASTLTQTLTRCDSTFFNEIYHQRAKLSRVAPLTLNKHSQAGSKPLKTAIAPSGLLNRCMN